MSDSYSKAAALTAISEEVEKLLETSLPANIREVIERVASIARHEFDVRTDAEQIASRP